MQRTRTFRKRNEFDSNRKNPNTNIEPDENALEITHICLIPDPNKNRSKKRHLISRNPPRLPYLFSMIVKAHNDEGEWVDLALA